ncbi:hypothetical protein A2U01_0112425, partial [Trifolium medium]|nr:hypothetical protein [Trifolium medium]
HCQELSIPPPFSCDPDSGQHSDAVVHHPEQRTPPATDVHHSRSNDHHHAHRYPSATVELQERSAAVRRA